MTARFRRPVARIVAPLLLAPVLLAAAPTAPAVASPAPPAECQGLPPVGDKPPVLLVHGYMSGPGTWGPEGSEDADGLIESELKREGVFVDRFDYSYRSVDWVDHPEIGPRLADRISELAAASECAGGGGKVLLVAHSMGGLAVRCALALSCGGRPSTDDKVGLVVTMGTPHTGSHLRGSGIRSGLATALGSALWMTCLAADYALTRGEAVPPVGAPYDADLCDQVKGFGFSNAGKAFAMGSSQIAALPPLPEGIPVRALSGQLNLTVSPGLFGKSRTFDVGDGPVGVQSATAQFTDGPLAGKHQYSCGSVWENRECSHVEMTNNERFTGPAVEAIRAYMSSDGIAQSARDEQEMKERAEGGILGAPTGPVLKVPDAVGGFPFAAQAIAAETYVEFGVPAPSGQEWAVVALQLRPLVHDRSWQMPEAFMFNLQWPDEKCRSSMSEDLYRCTTAVVEAVNSYFPVDAQSWDDPRAVEEGGIAEQGERYDVVIKALVPEEFDLATARLQVPLRMTSRGSKEWIPLSGLPQFGSG